MRDPHQWRQAAAVIACGIILSSCDRPSPAELRVAPERDRDILLSLEHAGYQGPVLVAERTAADERGTGPTTRSLFLPRSGRDRLRAAVRGSAQLDHALTNALSLPASALEAETPDGADPSHNAPAQDLGRVVNPSRLNGRSPVQSLVNYSSVVFYDYDWATDTWFQVPGGEVLETIVEAADSSGGHWHGSGSETQRRRRDRVGYMKPDKGTFTGSWSTTWYAPEFSQQVDIRYVVRESGGPNDGQTALFFSYEPDATRLYGLVRLPANDAHYAREGGTAIHPEAFNDWGTPQMIASIQSVAAAYSQATGGQGRTRVNDIALFYGGRFDIGRAIPGQGFARCSDANPAVCWNYSHYEHRYGTEVDINPERNVTAANRARFYRLLATEFASVKVEGDHYHARLAQSPYVQ